MCIGLQQLKTREHKIKKCQVEVDYQQLTELDETPHPLETDESDYDGEGEGEGEGKGKGEKEGEGDEEGKEKKEEEGDGGGEGGRGSTKVHVEVSNVPGAVTKEALKAFFEGTRSGGCAGAVADINGISPGAFHVTFYDRTGETLYQCVREPLGCVTGPAFHIVFSSV